MGYMLVALLATILGSMAGLGGGVIIKPILDLIGEYDSSTISVLSSCTVFAMAVVSILKQIKYKVNFNGNKTIFLAIGSIIGGLLGEKLISVFISLYNNMIVTIVQNIILAIILILIVIYMKYKENFKSYKIDNIFYCVVIGGLLGLISSFLSIGGGPINVCFLVVFFSMTTKEAAVNSIVIILFSQASKLVTIIMTKGIAVFSLPVVPLMIIGGIIGGIIGARLNRISREITIDRVFISIILVLVVISGYNAISKFEYKEDKNLIFEHKI